MVNFEWRFESLPVKSVLCILQIYTNYKLPVFRTNFLKLKFWKLLSNSLATFNLDNVNLLPNVNPQNGVSCKKNVYCHNYWIMCFKKQRHQNWKPWISFPLLIRLLDQILIFMSNCSIKKDYSAGLKKIKVSNDLIWL